MIKKYIHFTTSTTEQQRPFIIPFHLNFKMNLLPSGTLSLKTLRSSVETLCQIFGPQCVSTLTLTNRSVCTEENVKELCVFLALVSPGLETLDLRGLHSTIDFLKSQDPIITFPKLKKMICNTRESEFGTEGQATPAYISIIENSPDLEELTLTQPCDLDSWPLKFNQLKSLSLDPFINPQAILDKVLASSGPPVLRELIIADNGWSDKKTIVLCNILKSVSSTLKSLIFRQPLFCRNSAHPRIMRFPKLPHLEHLGLQYYNGRVCYLNPEDINLSVEETFPSLKSIELPIGLNFTPSPVQSQKGHEVKIEFPNVTKLTLRMGDTAGPEDLKGTLEHLQKIFPTPSKLSLVNVGGNYGVKYLLERIINSNWSKKFQAFEIIGFCSDYLGEVLNGLEFNPRVVLENCHGILEESIRNEFQDVMKRMGMEYEENVLAPGSIILTRANQSDFIKMTNITAMKLEFSEDSYNLYTSHLSPTPSNPNLTCFLKYFPQLRLVEISELLFLPQDKSTWTRHIQEFKSKFPAVIVKVT